MGRKRNPGTPDATMQLDAVVDDLEEIEAPVLAEMHLDSMAPPPLPPKRAGASAWLVGGLVVVLAACAAIGIGLVLRATRTGAAPTPAAAATPPAPETPAAEEPATEPATVQMEAIVFDDEVAAEPAAEEEPEPPAE